MAFSEHCCKEMTEVLEEGRFALVYWPQTRFYGIGKKHPSASAYRIRYCPWCATELPKDLLDELNHIIFNELHLDLSDKQYRRKLPKEFKTDEWWKKRGL